MVAIVFTSPGARRCSRIEDQGLRWVQGLDPPALARRACQPKFRRRPPINMTDGRVAAQVSQRWREEGPTAFEISVRMVRLVRIAECNCEPQRQLSLAVKPASAEAKPCRDPFFACYLCLLRRRPVLLVACAAAACLANPSDPAAPTAFVWTARHSTAFFAACVCVCACDSPPALLLSTASSVFILFFICLTVRVRDSKYAAPSRRALPEAATRRAQLDPRFDKAQQVIFSQRSTASCSASSASPAPAPLRRKRRQVITNFSTNLSTSFWASTSRLSHLQPPPCVRRNLATNKAPTSMYSRDT